MAHKTRQGATNPHGRSSEALGSASSPSTPGVILRSRSRWGVAWAAVLVATPRWETSWMGRTNRCRAPPYCQDPGLTGSVCTRGCLATVSRQPGIPRAFRETQRPLEGKGRKPVPESNIAPTVFLSSCSSLCEIRTERGFWAESQKLRIGSPNYTVFHFNHLIMIMMVFNTLPGIVLSI